MVLTGESNATNLLEIPSPLAHLENSTLRLSQLPMSEVRTCLNTYTMFLVARHPFERLLSAYRNKFVDNLPSSKYFQVNYNRLSVIWFDYFLETFYFHASIDLGLFFLIGVIQISTLAGQIWSSHHKNLQKEFCESGPQIGCQRDFSRICAIPPGRRREDQRTLDAHL